MEIGERIFEVRNILKKSQEEFGEQIKLTKFTISNYESGRRNVTDRVISDICREFNVNELWLRTGVGEMFDNGGFDFEKVAAKISLSNNEVLKELVELLWRANLGIDDLKILKLLIEEFRVKK